MKSIIFIAPPAAGKGTISRMFNEKYGIPDISVGALLRDEASTGSEIGKIIHDKQTKGILVDNDITIQVLKNRLMHEDCKNGYILDGYPRNLVQAEAYDEILREMNKDLGIVVLLNVPYEEIKKRIVGRLSCNDCGAIYNLFNPKLKPKDESLCDKCGGNLVKRSDDNEESFAIRYQTYQEVTEPLIDYYRNKGCLHEVDSIDSKEAFEKIEQLLKGM